MSSLKKIRLFEHEDLTGNQDGSQMSLKNDGLVEIMRMVFLDHYFLFLARKYNGVSDEPVGEYLFLTKNMIVHNAQEPFMIHHESCFLEKVVNARHKLLYTMGKDLRFNEENQPDEQAYFIKIWDFMSLVEGTEQGCKYSRQSSVLVLSRALFVCDRPDIQASTLMALTRHPIIF